MHLIVLLFVLCSWSQPAMAYIDPVNGAMLLQLLLSGIAGALVVFRRVIGSFFTRLKARWKASRNE
jgi:hypothetical protein